MTHPVALTATTSYRIAARYFSTSYVLCGRKPNIQRPRIPGTERRILDAVTVPVLPPDTRPLPQQCFDALELKRQANTSELGAAYLAFRLQQAIKMFNENTMVVICHNIPLIPRDAFRVKAKIVTAGMKIMFARNDIAQKAIAGTRLRNLEPFLVSDNVYIVSDKNLIPELVALLKKTPELQLLGGLVEDHILSRDDILNLAKLPPLDIMRGELLSILSASASTTSRHLSAHQEELSNNLDQLVKQSGDSGEK
ncbi:unnamed protein product [Candidula unifasciata]|uniref:Large ribosomal subunit protein uL10m n=1 Tax=Candidula unifasciata TaxID=100452 RepID=A0A8S3ZGD0_9EUPU|nr:unnamed protein product [Candidula unifasciata]